MEVIKEEDHHTLKDKNNFKNWTIFLKGEIKMNRQEK